MVTEGRTGSGRPKTARWNGREASVPGGGHKPHHWSWRSGEGMPICLQRPAGALPRSPFLLASTHFPRGASWQTYFTGRPSAQLPPTDRKNETTCGLAPQPQGEAPLTEAPGPGRPGFILLFAQTREDKEPEHRFKDLVTFPIRNQARVPRDPVGEAWESRPTTDTGSGRRAPGCCQEHVGVRRTGCRVPSPHPVPPGGLLRTTHHWGAGWQTCECPIPCGDPNSRNQLELPKPHNPPS